MLPKQVKEFHGNNQYQPKGNSMSSESAKSEAARRNRKGTKQEVEDMLQEFERSKSTRKNLSVGSVIRRRGRDIDAEIDRQVGKKRKSTY